MQQIISKFLSLALHPLLMPLISVYSLFYTSSYFMFRINEKFIHFIYFTVFVFTCLLPSLTIFTLYKTGMIKNLESPDKEQRGLPYLITIIFYVSAYYTLSRLPLPGVILLAIVGATVIISFTAIINYFWKISAHMIGVGGWSGTLLALSFKYFLDTSFFLSLSFLCAGLLGYARLYLDVHNQTQIYSGFLLGCVLQFSIVYFF